MSRFKRWFSRGPLCHASNTLWNRSPTRKYHLFTKSGAIWEIRLCKSTHSFATVINQDSRRVTLFFYPLCSLNQGSIPVYLFIYRGFHYHKTDLAYTRDFFTGFIQTITGKSTEKCRLIQPPHSTIPHGTNVQLSRN